MADKIRLGLIGASVRGTWSARSHLPALQPSSGVELTAVCTTKADSAEAARRAWGARLAFDDYRKMVASPEIDAVAVVVRVPSHYAPTKPAATSSLMCIKAGLTRACRPTAVTSPLVLASAASSTASAVVRPSGHSQ